jgi:PPM family protein phosphatase
MKLAVAFSTDVGRVREGNEDSFLIDEQLGLFAVADGMGGHVGGEVASTTAIEALRAAVAQGQAIDTAIISANAAVLERAAGDRSLAGMGTTLTAMRPLSGSQLLLGHVGDSRAYLLREGALERLTEDHSLVEELVRDGRITREQAEVHPQRNIVTRALGVDDDIDVDLLTLDVITGDRLLLCSDGLTSMVRERDVARVLGSSESVQAIADQLVDAAVANGGEDNVTVVVVDVLDAGTNDNGNGAADVATAAATSDDLLPESPSNGPTAAMASDALADDLPAEVAAPAPMDTTDALAPRRKRRWFRTVRGILLAALPVLVVLAAGAVALHWVTYRSFYVGTSGRYVAIYNGDPDSIVSWWGPHRVALYHSKPLARLTEESRAKVLQHGGWCAKDSLDAVRACVGRLSLQQATP